MNEAETRAELIDPALTAAGWGTVDGSRVRREFIISPGSIEGRGRRRNPSKADYVLEYRNTRLGVVEAKARSQELTEGVAQAKVYADKLRVRFTFSTNGTGIYCIDMLTGEERELSAWPTPAELWNLTFTEANAWRDRFAEVGYEDKGGSHPARYYQDIAIERVLQAVSTQQNRVLLTLATGTGKTFVAFQIAWKLFLARWNLSGQPTRRPRILFLADRNILANQAYNAFSAFPEDALVRISPKEIRKRGRVPKNGSLFFTIFQTFMTGPNGEPAEQEPDGVTAESMAAWFSEYPPDFFDFVIVDECHRGGANDESTWRGILEYFSPAVQLGLTATPKRTENADTYRYFGEPVFVYSLKDGINDGFLTPFRVRQIRTTLDEYVFSPDDNVLIGEIEEGRIYREGDFNRIIEIRERERKRVEIFMSQIDQREKTLVFCATQDHALAVRDLINQLKRNPDPNYCQRVTANDGELGEQFLREFQNNEKTIPTILTTSQKLSTGVDARNVRNIVLMRPVNSMIEFKQIIGRGTRLYDGKDYFTIYDFVGAHQHFLDPEWDGEPVAPEPAAERLERDPEADAADESEGVSDAGERGAAAVRRQAVQVRLADGKARNIQHMTCTSFWHPDGRPMSAQQFMELLFGRLPEFFHDEDELRGLWSDPETRRQLLQGLSDSGFGVEQLQEMQRIIDAESSDLFDVLAYVAFAQPPVTREARAAGARQWLAGQFSDRQRAFLEFVLQHYVTVGVEELDVGKLSPLLRLRYHDSLADAFEQLGPPAEINQMFTGFQKYLYVKVP